VKHADGEALDRLDPLLAELRTVPGLTEKKRGVFYRGSRAFVHFHVDPAGLFADVRLSGEFERVEVTLATQQRALLRRIRHALAATHRQA
jgi:hypothetical protein